MIIDFGAINEAYHRLVVLAWCNQTVETELLSNPAGAFERYLGFNFPPFLAVFVDPCFERSLILLNTVPGKRLHLTMTLQLPFPEKPRRHDCGQVPSILPRMVPPLPQTPTETQVADHTSATSQRANALNSLTTWADGIVKDVTPYLTATCSTGCPREETSAPAGGKFNWRCK